MAKITLSGEVGIDITLYKMVAEVKQLQEQGELSEIEIDITSIGGDSVEARNIYEYLKTLPYTIKTNAVDYVYSAGFTIFLAGNIRTANGIETEFLMHSPMIETAWFGMLNDSELEQLHELVLEEKKLLSRIYADSLSIESKTIETLMDKDQIISADTAKDLGIISSYSTELVNEMPDYRIAAKWYINNKHKNLILNSKKMKKEQIEKLQTEMEEQKSVMKQILEGVKNVFKTPEVEIKNLDINAEDGTMLVISGEVMEVGAAVESPSEGTFTVIQDGKTWTVVIAENVITELTEVVEEEVDEMAALKTENDELKAQIEELKNSFEVIEAKFNENAEYVTELKNIKGQFMKDDGSVNFENIKNLKTPEQTDMAQSVLEVRELYKKK